MEASNEETPLCTNCKKSPAVEKYTRGGRTVMLCAPCFDRWNVQDEYEGKTLYIYDLERGGKYDEVLACLDAILESNRDRDHDRWLARSIAHHRVQLLWDAGRYAEAEQACNAWAELGFADIGDRLMHALEIARIFEESGRDREALAALEDALGHGEALGHEDVRYLDPAPYPLAQVAHLSEKLGQPVDPKWRRLAEAVADEFGVEMPANDSLAQALVTLEEITRSAKPKRQREWEAEHGTDSDE